MPKITFTLKDTADGFAELETEFDPPVDASFPQDELTLAQQIALKMEDQFMDLLGEEIEIEVAEPIKQKIQ